MKTTIIAGAVIIVILSVLYVVLPAKPATAPAATTDSSAITSTTTLETLDGDTTATSPDTPAAIPPGKIKADVFVGTLQKVDTGCFADGECFAVVDNKHVTLTVGRSQEEVGSIIGAPSIGDLESYIGKSVEIYAKDNMDGTYSLYGSKGFYIKVIEPVGTKPTTGSCIVGGCSGQLCVDSAQGDTVTNCMWSEQYACYKTAECKRQANGQCGWTDTAELRQCIASKS